MAQPRSRSCRKYLLIRLQNAGLSSRTSNHTWWCGVCFSNSFIEFEFAFFLEFVFKRFQWPTYLCYPSAQTASYFDCYSLSKVTATLSFYAAAEVPFMLDLVESVSDHSVVLVHIPFYFVSFLSSQD